MKRWVPTTAKPDLDRHRPKCMFAHALIDQLGAIFGKCDLLKVALAHEPRYVEQLQGVQDIVMLMVEQLRAHQCELEAITRTALEKKCTDAVQQADLKPT